MSKSDLEIEYCDRNISAWGGMKLMKDLIDRSGIKKQLTTLNIPHPGSNRGYKAIDIIESFWIGIMIGASRFSHCSWLRFDKVLQEIFGWAQVPSQSTVSRFFHKFSWKRNTEVFTALQGWFFEQLHFTNMTMDIDSSVLTRYGTQ